MIQTVRMTSSERELFIRSVNLKDLKAESKQQESLHHKSFIGTSSSLSSSICYHGYRHDQTHES